MSFSMGPNAVQDGVTVCPDDHRCENLSSCVELMGNEGSFFCDCDTQKLHNEVQYEKVRYAGLYCEHEATDFCDSGHFCVNNGKCHPKKDGVCKCLSAYSGSHCEFLQGSAPYGWATVDYARNFGSAGALGEEGGGTRTALFLIALTFIVVGTFIQARRNKMRRANGGAYPFGADEDASNRDEALNDFKPPPAAFMKTPIPLKKSRSKRGSNSTRSFGHVPVDLQLDPDGASIREAVRVQLYHENSSGSDDNMGGEFDDDTAVVDVQII